MIKTIEQFLKTNPNASLKEYQEYISEETLNESNNRTNELQKMKEWYNELTGRYFLINFNNTSFRAVYINSPFDGSFKTYNMYLILSDYNTCSISYQNTVLNPEWLNCPFNKKTNKVQWIKEISAFEYNQIVEKHKQIQNIVKEIIK